MPLTACSSLGGSGGSASLTGVAERNRLDTSFTTFVYAPGPDANTADFYMSDLPPDVWERGGDVTAYSGNLVQVHMFISPRAGSTPIANTASSGTIRWLVLSRGQIGVYGGGGFVTKSGDVGDESLGAKFTDATLRPLMRTAGFDDRLGPCILTGSITADKNQATADLMSRAMIALMGEAQTLPK